MYRTVFLFKICQNKLPHNSGSVPKSSFNCQQLCITTQPVKNIRIPHFALNCPELIFVLGEHCCYSNTCTVKVLQLVIKMCSQQICTKFVKNLIVYICIMILFRQAPTSLLLQYQSAGKLLDWWAMQLPYQNFWKNLDTVVNVVTRY